MKIRLVVASQFCWLAFAMAAPVHAGIYLDRVIVEFDPNGLPREDVVVFNDDDAANAYVDVTVLEVRNPGTPDEERIEIDDPANSNLLVTPARMVIPPSGRVQVRMVSLAEDNDQDVVYRVNFTPVLPPLQADQSAVRIVVAYQALVIIPPAQPESQLEYSREGDNMVTFTNRGNSYVKLEGGQVCAGEQCQELPPTRLYAGTSWNVELPMQGQVSYRAVNERNTRVIQID